MLLENETNPQDNGVDVKLTWNRITYDVVKQNACDSSLITQKNPELPENDTS